MKLYRFIGIEEFEKLLAGETVKNENDYSKDHDTNSKGFCFFANNRTNDAQKVFASAIDYLGGIVDAYYMIEVDLDNPTKTFGYYAAGKKTEYNVTEYNFSNIKNIYRVNARIAYIPSKVFTTGKGQNKITHYIEGKVCRIPENVEKW